MTWLLVAIALLAGVVVGYLIREYTDHEFADENRHLRATLRYTRGVIANSGQLPSVARYIDHVLGDEAGESTRTRDARTHE